MPIHVDPPRRSRARASRLGLVLALALLAVAAPADAQSGAPNQPVHPPGELTDHELDIWNSKVFQERFAESYLANTDIEPEVTTEERDVLLEVTEFMKDNRLGKALERLEEERTESATAVFDFTVANIHFQREGTIEPNDPNDPTSVEAAQQSKARALEQAAAAYRIAVEKEAKFRRAWRNLGVVYVRMEKYDQAAPALTRVVALGGGDSVIYGLLGFSYSRVKNPISAESAYRMAILLDPQTFDWKMGLAQSFFEQRRYHEAVALCRMLLAEQPKRVPLWILQANAFIKLDEPLKAAENYEMLDAMGASTGGTLSTLGDIYINEDLYKLAVDAYMQVMSLEGERADPSRVVRAAKALTARNAMDEADRLIRRIEEVYADRLDDETRTDLLRIRARMKMAEGDGASDQAAQILEQIVRIDPMDGQAYIQLGQHYSRKGERMQERAQQLKAEDKPDEAGQALGQMRSLFAKAEDRFEHAEQIEGYEADALVRHAQLMVKQKKYQQALSLLRRAQRLKPRDNVQDYLDQIERLAKSQST
ncbi:MAG: tetratricopeptide repeat protein [Planctomycetes bacterium]|nr:tetratricopeptide repeat protein [Planctomycetota bacterium]